MRWQDLEHASNSIPPAQDLQAMATEVNYLRAEVRFIRVAMRVLFYSPGPSSPLSISFFLSLSLAFFSFFSSLLSHSCLLSNLILFLFLTWTISMCTCKHWSCLGSQQSMVAVIFLPMNWGLHEKLLPRKMCVTTSVYESETCGGLSLYLYLRVYICIYVYMCVCLFQIILLSNNAKRRFGRNVGFQ